MPITRWKGLTERYLKSKPNEPLRAGEAELLYTSIKVPFRLMSFIMVLNAILLDQLRFSSAGLILSNTGCTGGNRRKIADMQAASPPLLHEPEGGLHLSKGLCSPHIMQICLFQSRSIRELARVDRVPSSLLPFCNSVRSALTFLLFNSKSCRLD